MAILMTSENSITIARAQGAISVLEQLKDAEALERFLDVEVAER